MVRENIVEMIVAFAEDGDDEGVRKAQALLDKYDAFMKKVEFSLGGVTSKLK